MTEKLNPSVEFAAEIVGIAIEKEHDTSTVMNGMAVAAASFLLDMSLREDGTLDEALLYICTEAFVETVSRAVDFAKAELNLVA